MNALIVYDSKFGNQGIAQAIGCCIGGRVHCPGATVEELSVIPPAGVAGRRRADTTITA